MVIYEVNLHIDEVVYKEFRLWLDEHIKEMLAIPGFIQAMVLKQIDGDGAGSAKQITVHYQLKGVDELNTYFEKYAPKLRSEGLKRFDGQFKASRRSFEVDSLIHK